MIEGRPKNSTSCPKCGLILNQLVPSSHHSDLCGFLKVKCQKCEGIFNAKEDQVHSCCTTSKVAIVSEEAAYKFIKLKMDSSNLPNRAIKLKTGGPWVRKYYIQYIII